MSSPHAALLTSRKIIRFKDHKNFLSYFFVKKYLLVGASSMLWVDGSVSQSVSERCMDFTPIRLDLL